MYCKRCGNPVKPGENFCAQCGLPVEQQLQMDRTQLTITPQEAAQGCQKVIQLPDLSAPLRITLQPGVRQAQTLVIHNAKFRCPDGRQETRPLYVTVYIAWNAAPEVKKKRPKWWIPVVVIFVALLAIGIVRSIADGRLSADVPQQDTADMPPAEKAVQELLDNVSSTQQAWTDEQGYVDPEDLEESVDAVCRVLEEADSVTYYEKNDYCVYFECDDNAAYVYVPKLEDYALNGDGMKIVTVQPYYTENITRDTARRYDHHALDENAGLIRDTYAQWDFYDAGTSYDDDINDDEITVERMLSLDDYKMILWQGHGSYTQKYGYLACTPVKYTEQIGETYESYFDKRYILRTTEGNICFTEAFFENCYEENAFDGAIIYMGTCLSGYTPDFAQILLDKGAAAVYVNSDTIPREYNLNMLRAVGENLCRGETILQAMDSAKNLHGDSATTKKQDGTYAQTYVYCVAQDGVWDLTLQQLTEQKQTKPAYWDAYTYVLTDIGQWQAGPDVLQNNYTLYDIDLDGMPECILELGDSEADSTYVIYTVWDEEPIYLGVFSASHSTLYGEVGGGLTVMSGHMGSETCRSVGITDGVFSESLLYMAEVDRYWDEICQVQPLQQYALDDFSGLYWTGNPNYDNWGALEPARARVFS